MGRRHRPRRFADFVVATSIPAEGEGYAQPEELPEPAVLAAEAAARGIEILGPPGAMP